MTHLEREMLGILKGCVPQLEQQLLEDGWNPGRRGSRDRRRLLRRALKVIGRTEKALAAERKEEIRP